MRNQFEDKRVYKTNQLLRTGLTELMNKKGSHDITVRELAEHVHICRGTFYLHYLDIEDLISSIENELLADLDKALGAYTVEEVKKKPILLYEKLFCHFCQNGQFYQTYFNGYGNRQFLTRLSILTWIKFKESLPEIFPENPMERNLFMAFTEAGFVGIYRNWLRDGMKSSSAQLAQYTMDFILRGKNSFSLLCFHKS